MRVFKETPVVSFFFRSHDEQQCVNTLLPSSQQRGLANENEESDDQTPPETNLCEGVHVSDEDDVIDVDETSVGVAAATLLRCNRCKSENCQVSEGIDRNFIL